MAYGIEVTSETDSSLLISSDATSYAHYNSVNTVQATASGAAYVAYYELSLITTVKPIYFIEVNSIACKPVSLQVIDSKWVLTTLVPISGQSVATDFPRIHVFHSVNDMTLNSDTYGLNVYNEGGDLTYTSRMDSDLLKVQAIVTLNQNCNFTTVAGTTIGTTISRPSLMYNTNFHGVNSVSGSGSSWYNYYYSSGILLNTSTSFACTIIGHGGFPSTTQRDHIVLNSDTQSPQTSIISATDYD